MGKEIKNISDSVKQRPLNLARERNVLFEELYKLYTMERFLYRISKSKYRKQLILKGALMLPVWDAPQSRPTKDIDLLGRISNDLDTISEMIKDICDVEVEPDGLVFDKSSVKVERITEDSEYHGIRIKVISRLGSARVTNQIDIGFGDVVFPEPKQIEYPTILDSPKPIILSYSKESSIAEKLQAMVKLEKSNSRMKDFYDIWLLSRTYEFDGKVLSAAIRETFEIRGTKVDPNIFAFTKEFSEDSSIISLWKGFLSRSKIQNIVEDFSSIVRDISDFLMPVVKAIYHDEVFDKTWFSNRKWS